MSEVLFLRCFYRCSSACINGLISPHIDVILEDENSVQSFVLNPGCCPHFWWSHVLLNHRSTATVNRHFVKSTAPRGQRAVKSALNPGYSRVKPPLCPGGRGAGVSIDWCTKRLLRNFLFFIVELKFERYLALYHLKPCQNVAKKLFVRNNSLRLATQARWSAMFYLLSTQGPIGSGEGLPSPFHWEFSRPTLDHHLSGGGSGQLNPRSPSVTEYGETQEDRSVRQIPHSPVPCHHAR